MSELTNTFTDIADAIREKTGKSELMTPSNMANEVRSISGGGGEISDSTPIGTIHPFAGSSIPEGFLACDGSAISRTSYADLFDVIGTTWGSGDGSTTFNLPDLREVALVGIGESTRSERAHDVYQLGTFKDDQFQTHTHSITRYTSSGSSWQGESSCSHSGAYTTYTNAPNTGRTGDVTRGKRIGVNYIIKYKMVSAPISGGSGQELLWTNSNPTANFGAQTISVPGLSKYDYIEIFANYTASSPDSYAYYSKSLKGKGGALSLAWVTGTGSYGTISLSRRYTVDLTNETISFEAGQTGYTGNVGVDNAFAIPYKIYGGMFEGSSGIITDLGSYEKLADIPANVAQDTVITLSDALTNYDYLLLEGGPSMSYNTALIPTPVFTANDFKLGLSNAYSGGSWARIGLEYYSRTQVKVWRQEYMGSAGVLYGIKKSTSKGSMSKWKLVDSKTGTDAINLPVSFNELHVRVRSANSDSDNYTFRIISDDLSNTVDRSFRNGWFASVSGQNYHEEVIIKFTKMKSVEITTVTINGVNNTATSTIALYYR